MTEREFMAKLSAELNKLNLADAAEIIGEYKQHFAFKLADGLSEEEIAAKLGDPLTLAAQFEAGSETLKQAKRRNAISAFALRGSFAAVSLITLGALSVVFGAVALACLAIGVCLLLRLNIAAFLPPMPFGSAAIFGIAILALSALATVALIYCFTYMRSLLCPFRRSTKNTEEEGSFCARRKPLFSESLSVRLRLALRIFLIIFAASFLLGVFVSMQSSGAFEFWHAWGWFGYVG